MWAFDAAKGYAWLVTVYRPDATRWSADFSNAGEAMTDGPSKCPRCGGDVDSDSEREIDRPVRVGDDIALVNALCANETGEWHVGAQRTSGPHVPAQTSSESCSKYSEVRQSK